MTEPRIGFTPSFTGSLGVLHEEDRSRCWSALEDFSRDPGHQGLRFGRIQGISMGRLFKIRAARDVRIILAREGSIYCAVLAGVRDQIYERARRGRFVIDLAGGDVGFIEVPRSVDPDEEEERRRPVGERTFLDEDRPRPFSLWPTTDLLEVGFDTSEVETLRACQELVEVLGLIDHGWDEETVNRALSLVEVTPEQWRNQSLFGDAGEERLHRALEDFGSLGRDRPDCRESDRGLDDLPASAPVGGHDQALRRPGEDPGFGGHRQDSGRAALGGRAGPPVA